MNLATHTALGRHVDLRYRSNRIAIAGTVVAGSVIAAARWIASREVDLLDLTTTGIGVFLAWAVARELDPDNPGAASLAMVVATVFALAGPPAAAIVAVALLAIRILVGTVGTPLRPADVILLLAAAGYAGSRPDGWPAAVALTVAVALAHNRSHPWLPAAMGGASLIVALVVAPGADPGFDSPLSLLLVAVSLIAAWYTRRVKTVVSTTDAHRLPILEHRVSAGRLAAGLLVAATLLLGGAPAAMTPVVGALVGVALRQRRHLRVPRAESELVG